MCRRCGEPDRRGSAEIRRRRRRALLRGLHNSFGGNGVITVCVWCGVLVAEHAGYLPVVLPGGRVQRLPIRKLEQDRLRGHGSPYSLWNLVPACGPCNKARTYDMYEIPPGCPFGPEVAARRRAFLAGDLEADIIDIGPFIESTPEDDLAAVAAL